MNARPTTTYPQTEGSRFTGRGTRLVVVECTCGIHFAIPDQLNEGALAYPGPKGWQISCPLGHTWHYRGDDDLETRLRKELDAEKERRARTAAERDQAEASLRATKGVVTRMKNRAKAGVCPAAGCHRHFADLEKHVATMHPDGLA